MFKNHANLCRENFRGGTCNHQLMSWVEVVSRLFNSQTGLGIDLIHRRPGDIRTGGAYFLGFGTTFFCLQNS